MEDKEYELGFLKAQVEQMNKTVSAMEVDVKEIKEQLLTMKSTAAGAVFVLSVIGSVILFFADALIQYVKVKLGS